jgi:hypothetical protein
MDRPAEADPSTDHPFRRLVVVDEAWQLMYHPGAARFPYRTAKAARKRSTGLTVITQDTADLLATDLGRAVVANAATDVLLRQAPQAVDAVAGTYHLTAGERQLLLTAGRGTGLLVAGTHRTGLQVVASPSEHALLTTGLAMGGQRFDLRDQG